MEKAQGHSSHSPAQMTLVSPFTNLLSVETWDAWFRWREDGCLRDLTIDATWDRVATALAAIETGAGRVDCKRRLMEAFAAWQLLLDERVIATAGTPGAAWSNDRLIAVLNVATFVRAPCTRRATFDQDAFEEVAALAVRALENAALIRSEIPLSASRLRIGVIGLGDALALLGLAYDSAPARAQAAAVAQALANGCVAGSIALASDRGALVHGAADWRRRARLRECPNELIEDAACYGLRHTELTAVTSQQRLAWFANNVADAVDPALNRDVTLSIATLDGKRTVHAGGYALSMIRQLGHGCAGVNILAASPQRAQLELRTAMQPWIDEPINYPLSTDGNPGNGVNASHPVVA